MARLGKKGPKVAHPSVARQLDRLSKAALLDLAYSLAARCSESADNPAFVYDVLRYEWTTIAMYRQDGIKLCTIDEPEFYARNPKPETSR